MKNLIVVLAVLAVITAACAPAEQRGTKIVVEPEVQDLVEDSIQEETSLPEEDSSDLSDPELIKSLGIIARGPDARFLSPILKDGDFAVYSITIKGQGKNEEYTTSYKVVRMTHRGDSCIGIEKNSTLPGSILNRNIWCGDKKYSVFWNAKTGGFNTPQLIKKDTGWNDENIRGFSLQHFESLERVTVEAGTFLTLHKSLNTSIVTNNYWHSPTTPGFESGLVKSTEVSEGITITKELVDYG